MYIWSVCAGQLLKMKMLTFSAMHADLLVFLLLCVSSWVRRSKYHIGCIFTCNCAWNYILHYDHMHEIIHYDHVFLKNILRPLATTRRCSKNSQATNIHRRSKDGCQVIKVDGKVAKMTLVSFDRFFEKLGDVSSALNFLVMSHCQEEAFTMAQVQTWFSITEYLLLLLWNL